MSRIKTSDSISPWVRTILILPAYLIIAGLFQWAGYLVLGLDPSSYNLDKSPVQETIGALFTLTGTIVTVGIFRRFIDEESFISMGFYHHNILNETLFGIGLGALIMATGFVALILIHEINWLGLKVEADNIFLGIGLFVMVALTEEMLLRGYVLNNLMKSMNRLIALPVSAFMFSLGHIFNNNFSWMGFSNIFLAGILLGMPYIYTKSLWLPIALHFSWNFFQGIVFGFNVSGHVTYSLINQTRTSDTIWNGGKFGFEGSVLCIVFQSVAILGLWWYYSKRSKQYQHANVAETDHLLIENQCINKTGYPKPLFLQKITNIVILELNRIFVLIFVKSKSWKKYLKTRNTSISFRLHALCFGNTVSNGCRSRRFAGKPKPAK